MNGTQSKSPVSPLRYVISGMFLTVAGCLSDVAFTAFSPSFRHSFTARAWYFGVASVLLLAGAGLFFTGESRVKSGIKAHRWSDGELDAMKRQVAGWGWCFLTALPSMVLFVFLCTGRGRAGVSIVLAMWSLQIFLRLRVMFTPPQMNTELKISPNEVVPIRSEHWGEVPRATYPNS